MSQMLPPGLMDALTSQGGPGGPPPGPADYGGGPGGPGDAGSAPDPLQTLQACIQQLPGVIAALPDPRDTQDATKALHILAGIQTRMMQGGGGQGSSGGPTGY